MSSLLFKNIKSLVQVTDAKSPLKGSAMRELKTVENAWLLTEDHKIKDYGTMESCLQNADQIIDATDRMLLPAWCDSHTHLVYAGSRESEFVDRINGLSYEEIARRGGGILNSAARLRDTSENELFEMALTRLEEVKNFGTGAIEIKSGYGLTTASELKMLRVIRRLKASSQMTIKATFLGAHAVPETFKSNRQAYIDLIINEMLPMIAGEGLADYIDVFCEKVAFSVPETEQIIAAGAKHGLKAKIHTNQFNCLGGIQAAVKYDAVSVDHLEIINDEEIECLLDSNTISTLLPSAPFFINDHYPPGRKMLDAGLAVALGTDYNPGSTPSGKMPFVISLACIKMRMSPEEAINAATINGAFAMELAASHGSITKGKTANLILTKPIPSLAYIPYSFGSDLVEKVMLNGKLNA